MTTNRCCRLAVIGLALGGCAGGGSPLPTDGPTMQQVYDAHFNGAVATGSGAAAGALAPARVAAARPLHAGPAHLEAYTRTAWNETELLFAQLPNPAIVVYIDPHLSESGYPVPGYTTATRLYKDAPYAVPGEVPPPARARGVREPGL